MLQSSFHFSIKIAQSDQWRNARWSGHPTECHEGASVSHISQTFFGLGLSGSPLKCLVAPLHHRGLFYTSALNIVNTIGNLLFLTYKIICVALSTHNGNVFAAHKALFKFKKDLKENNINTVTLLCHWNISWLSFMSVITFFKNEILQYFIKAAAV